MDKSQHTFCNALGIIGLFIGIGTFLQALMFSDIFGSGKWIIMGGLVIGLLILTRYSMVYKRLVCRIFCSKNKLLENTARSEFRIEKYVLRRWKPPITIESPPREATLKNRRGRRSPTPTEDKIRAIQKWNRLNQRIDPPTLDEFIAYEFGTTGGQLNVSKRTFYDWRKKFGHLIDQDETQQEE